MTHSGVGFRYLRMWQAIGVIFVIAAFVVSLGPYPVRSSIHNLDKILHAATYAGLAYWFTQLSIRRRHVWVALGLVAMGILIEYLQSFTRTRTPDLYDALANSLGVALGWGVTFTPAGRLLSTVDSWIGHVIRSPEN
jgi:VanZ family protein